MIRDDLMQLADEMHIASPAGTDVHWKTLRRFSDRLRTLAQRAPLNGAVPEALSMPQMTTGVDVSLERAYRDGWNGCRMALLAAAPAPDARQPDGYAYRYEVGPDMTVIRINGGIEVNGAMPIEAIPYFYGKPEPEAERAKGEEPDSDWRLRGYAYASKQATNCAQCGEYKHTPLRIDAMGGYVCLTCIDRKLGALLGEFGYPAEPSPAGQPEGVEALLREFQLLDDAGLDEREHHCEWAIQQERKRLHAAISRLASAQRADTNRKQDQP